MQLSGISRNTTELGCMATLSPILHFPVILTPGLNNTLLPMIGRLSGVLFNPMTTPLFIWQLHPIDRQFTITPPPLNAGCAGRGRPYSGRLRFGIYLRDGKVGFSNSRPVAGAKDSLGYCGNIRNVSMRSDNGRQYRTPIS